MSDKSSRLFKLKQKREQLQKLREERERNRQQTAPQTFDVDALIGDVLNSQSANVSPSISEPTETPITPQETQSNPEHTTIENTTPLIVQNVIAPVTVQTAEIEIQTDAIEDVYAKTVMMTYEKECQTDEVEVKQISEDIAINEDTSSNDMIEEESKLEVPIINGNNSNNNKEGSEVLKENEKDEFEIKSFSVEFQKKVATDAMKNEGFLSFMNRSSKAIERALTQTKMFDIMVDYSADNITQESAASIKTKMLHDPATADAVNCAVSGLEWHWAHPELLLASYMDRPTDQMINCMSSGKLAVWSTQLDGRPEFTFSADAPVSCCTWNPSDAHLIVAGTMTGQMVMFDTRGHCGAIQRSALSDQCHRYPVVGTKGVGTFLYSLGSDGSFCQWDTRSLNTPTLKLSLEDSSRIGKSKDNHSLLASCMAIPAEDENQLFIGCEDGKIFSTELHGRDGTCKLVASHSAPLTSISCHPNMSQLADKTDVNAMVLSSGMDWTSRVWTQYSGDLSGGSLNSLRIYESPTETVFDGKWCPNHSSYFCLGTGSGMLELWKLGRDESPVTSYDPLAKSKGTNHEKHAINKVAWAPNGSTGDKCLLASGDSVGNICLMDVPSELMESDKDVNFGS
eukprot:TRINITY_DN883_c0_g1_i3.p1 TRINITY_DN883_c0_g1~~TRINITY_DN883_c0_g1_i3.p1  ORF type:complete len:625 (-),score=184.76 TRINITY_DN883_c0_g1_i3:337-2211(-)